MIIGADSTDAVPANPLWTFSLDLYGREGVAGICLELQDRLGLDVNLVLYTVFAAHCGKALSADDLNTVEAGIRTWRDGILRPLRVLRRQLDDSGDEHEARQALLAAELSLEQVQQHRMWQARSPSGDWQPIAGERPLEANFAALAQHSGCDEIEFRALVLALQSLLPLLHAEL